MQALARHAGTKPPRLWLCTRGAQRVNSVGRTLSPVAATVWGLGKVIALEHPELRCVRIDLDPEGRENEIEDFCAALDAEDDEDQSGATHGSPVGSTLAAHQETQR